MEKKNFAKKGDQKKDTQVGGFNYDEFYSNDLALNPEIKAQLKSEGLEWRFINRLQFREKGNSHRSHWQPYQLKTANGQAGVGTDAEGMVVRGDLVLAVRPKEIADRHRQFLEAKRARYRGYNREVADEMRQRAREEGVSRAMKVHEGYDDNE